MKAIQVMKLVVVAGAAMVAGGVFGANVDVSTSEALATAVANAQEGDVITLAKGTYEVPGKALVISNVTLKGATGNPADVIVKRRSNESNSVYYRNVELMGDDTCSRTSPWRAGATMPRAATSTWPRASSTTASSARAR